MNNINIKTGEVINEASPLEVKSEALKAVSIEVKRLRDIEEALKGLLEVEAQRAYNNGETTLADYWQVEAGRMTFDREAFEKTANHYERKRYKLLKQELKSIESKWKKVSKPYLKHPKY